MLLPCLNQYKTVYQDKSSVWDTESSSYQHLVSPLLTLLGYIQARNVCSQFR